MVQAMCEEPSFTTSRCHLYQEAEMRVCEWLEHRRAHAHSLKRMRGMQLVSQVYILRLAWIQAL